MIMKKFTHEELYGANEFTQEYKGYTIQYYAFLDQFVAEISGSTFWDLCGKTIDQVKDLINKDDITIAL